jgi:hypothetical protein
MKSLIFGGALAAAVFAFVGAACGGGDSGQGGAASGGAGATSGHGSMSNGTAGTGGHGATGTGTGGAPGPSALTCDPIACGPSNGNTVPVPTGADLQAALDAASPGDTLVLDAGATYTGHFQLTEKSGSGCITVRTSTSDQALPADTRVTPADAPKLARIITPGGGLPALATAARAHNWQFIGIEFAPESAQAQIYGLVDIGNGETTVADLPHDIVFDRCYVHAFPDTNFKRGIGLNGASICVIHSHVSDFHSDFQDAQALGGHNGSGPFRIIDNHLEASTENILFGGAVATIPNVVPTDIVVRGNHFYKPLAWKAGDPGNTGYTPWVKNLFELKNAQNVVLDGNILENNWVGADQHGGAIVLTPRSENGVMPWAVVQNVTITNNVILHVGGCADIAGSDNTGPVVQTNHIVISNNVCADVRQDYALDIVRVFQFSGIDTLAIEHNTFEFGAGSWPIFRTYADPTTGFSYSNNVVEFREGAWSDCGNDAQALSCKLPGGTIAGNAFVGGAAGSFPATNSYPASFAALKCVDYANGVNDFHDFALAPSSPFKGSGSDGKDPGIDPAAIDAARTGP